jgi:hypothetical protein
VVNRPDAFRSKRGAAGAALLLLALAALVGLTVFFSREESGSNEPLDPQNWRKNGGHALAELLRQQGVDLRIARTVDEARSATSSNTLLFITNSGYLSGEDTLRQVAALPGDRVVAEASFSALLHALAPGVEHSPTDRSPTDHSQGPREPGCAWSGALRAGAVQMNGWALRAPDTQDSCYDGEILRYRDNGRIITVVADDSFMSNERIADPGSAALALNLLGARRAVVWLALEFPQIKGEKVGPSLTGLIPDRVWWAARTLAVAVVVTALWQARRLGPVVVERLPVVVRASETAEGLGKLYQARRARGRAAAALREAAVGRLSKRLAIPVRDSGVMTAMLADRLGRSPDEIRSVLYGPVPADDSALVALAQELDRVEHGVLEGKVRGV